MISDTLTSINTGFYKFNRLKVVFENSDIRNFSIQTLDFVHNEHNMMLTLEVSKAHISRWKYLPTNKPITFIYVLFPLHAKPSCSLFRTKTIYQVNTSFYHVFLFIFIFNEREKKMWAAQVMQINTNLTCF